MVSPKKLGHHFFNLWKFYKSEKSVPESCRTHWNLKNDEQSWSLKLLKLKNRMGDKIIHPFCRISSLQECRSHLSLICGHLKSLRMILQNHAECIEPIEWRRIWVLKTVKIKVENGYQVIQLFCRNGFLQEIRSPSL